MRSNHWGGGSGSFAAIAGELTSLLGTPVDERPARPVHGGCINESYRWESRSGPLFVKVAAARDLGMLTAEAEGLQALEGAQAIRVPRVLAVGTSGDHAFLALEWIELSSPSSAASAQLGEQLAHQHRSTADRFGWHRDNTIGSTPQINTWTQTWPAFFRDHRLGFQLRLAARNGYDGRLQERGAILLSEVERFFESGMPQPSLLHGDLWGGNAGVDEQGRPVIFDPAVYYGDREADLAMTRLFGGFGSRFFAAYEAAWPLPEGARERVTLYNLYHVLNHLNLFGAGYLAQAESMIERLLSSLR